MRAWIAGIFCAVAVALTLTPAIAMTAAEKLNPVPEADVGMTRNYRDTWRWLELMNGEVENNAVYFFIVRTGTDCPADLLELDSVLHVMNELYEEMRKEDVEMLFVGRGNKEMLENRLRMKKANFPACHDDSKGIGAIPGYRSRPRKGITVVDADGNLVAEISDLGMLRSWRSIIKKWEALKKAKDDPGKMRSLLEDLLPGQKDSSDVLFGDVNSSLQSDTVPEDEQQQLDENSSDIADFLRKLDEDQAPNINPAARYFVAVSFNLDFDDDDEATIKETGQPLQNFLEHEAEKLREISKTRLRRDVQLFYVTTSQKSAEKLLEVVSGKTLVYYGDKRSKLFKHPSIAAACSHDNNDLPCVSVTRALDSRILAEGRKPVIDDMETILTAEEAKQSYQKETGEKE